MSNRKPTVAIDFDGTLHPYTDGWQGSVPADEPPTVPAMNAIYRFHNAGYRIVVFSARANHAEGLDGIRAWLDQYRLGGYIAEVTHEKPMAVAYVDDRGVAFTGDWDAAFTAVELLRGEHA